ncbi:hypothetical protein SADUNF_Sadunf16G0103100 [Salix dunnii]|uniref:Uncharacterized protein n=1 Tax=Salix dunnii TaxID=1413687 RepID=A0A835J948_9ROSI|nr:hypothetical protein SADUNF_Sadunf16G0103100 [Salix dunnii]
MEKQIPASQVVWSFHKGLNIITKFIRSTRVLWLGLVFFGGAGLVFKYPSVIGAIQGMITGWLGKTPAAGEEPSE